MRKLRLELDALAVETFDTRVDAVPTVGTVRGHDSEDPPNTDSTSTPATCCRAVAPAG